MAPMGPGTYGSQKGRPKKGGKDATSMAAKTKKLLKNKLRNK